LIFAKWFASKQDHHVLLLLMCLDNKKLISLETVMETNPWMYSRTQKKQHKKQILKNKFTFYSSGNERMGPPPPPYVMTTPQMTPVSPAGRSAMSAVQSPSIRSYNSPSISGYNYVPRQVIKELCHTLHVLTILHFVLSLGPRFYFL
jgi:hypothetical protein